MTIQQNLDKERFFPEIYEVCAGNDFTVYAYVCDGSIRLYDMKPLLKKGGVFEPLKDEAVFHSALTVMNGTIAFDLTHDRNPYTCIDIDPFSVFSAEIVNDFPTM